MTDSLKSYISVDVDMAACFVAVNMIDNEFNTFSSTLLSDDYYLRLKSIETGVFMNIHQTPQSVLPSGLLEPLPDPSGLAEFPGAVSGL